MPDDRVSAEELVEMERRAATIGALRDPTISRLIEADMPRLVRDLRDLRGALRWALSELHVPNQNSDPEYGLRHHAARALVPDGADAMKEA